LPQIDSVLLIRTQPICFVYNFKTNNDQYVLNCSL